MSNIVVLEKEQLEQTLRSVLLEIFARRDDEQEAKNVLKDDCSIEIYELADRWHVSKGTIHNYVKKGLIRPMRLGRRVLFPLSEILRAEREGLTKFKR